MVSPLAVYSQIIAIIPNISYSLHSQTAINIEYVLHFGSHLGFYIFHMLTFVFAIIDIFSMQIYIDIQEIDQCSCSFQSNCHKIAKNSIFTMWRPSWIFNFSEICFKMINLFKMHNIIHFWEQKISLNLNIWKITKLSHFSNLGVGVIQSPLARKVYIVSS